MLGKNKNFNNCSSVFFSLLLFFSFLVFCVALFFSSCSSSLSLTSSSHFSSPLIHPCALSSQRFSFSNHCLKNSVVSSNLSTSSISCNFLFPKENRKVFPNFLKIFNPIIENLLEDAFEQFKSISYCVGHENFPRYYIPSHRVLNNEYNNILLQNFFNKKLQNIFSFKISFGKNSKAIKPLKDSLLSLNYFFTTPTFSAFTCFLFPLSFCYNTAFSQYSLLQNLARFRSAFPDRKQKFNNFLEKKYEAFRPISKNILSLSFSKILIHNKFFNFSTFSSTLLNSFNNENHSEEKKKAHLNNNEKMRKPTNDSSNSSLLLFIKKYYPFLTKKILLKILLGLSYLFINHLFNMLIRFTFNSFTKKSIFQLINFAQPSNTIKSSKTAFLDASRIIEYFNKLSDKQRAFHIATALFTLYFFKILFSSAWNENHERKRVLKAIEDYEKAENDFVLFGDKNEEDKPEED